MSNYADYNANRSFSRLNLVYACYTNASISRYVKWRSCIISHSIDVFLHNDQFLWPVNLSTSKQQPRLNSLNQCYTVVLYGVSSPKMEVSWPMHCFWDNPHQKLEIIIQFFYKSTPFYDMKFSSHRQKCQTLPWIRWRLAKQCFQFRIYE